MFSPALDAVVAGVLGLLVGSFLNVVVHRLPRMMNRDWWREVQKMLSEPEPHVDVFGSPPPPTQIDEAERLARQLDAMTPLSLWRPRSRCPACLHQIRWYENIPVLSWLGLRGRCSNCNTQIGARYPIVEIVTAGFFAVCGYRWGLSPQAAAWAIFASLLICLFLIDMDTMFLPDGLNYVLLWLGLLVALTGWTVSLKDAVLGAIGGYMSLFLIATVFKLAMKKEGMGNGDFKLLAALGAWFGWKYLLAIILVSSIVGSVLGVLLLIFRKLLHRDNPMPFGPYLAGAGLVCLALGPKEVANLLPLAFPF